MAARDAYYPIIITFMVVNTIVVGLRVYTRLTTKSLGVDDALMLLAMIGFAIFGSMEITAIQYGIGATVMKASYDMMKAAKYFTIAQVVYIIASGITKLAVAAVLLRLTDNTEMHAARMSLIAMIGVVVCFTIAGTVIFSMQCRPLSVAWGIGTGTCLEASVIGQAALAVSVEDVVTSWFFGLLPVYMLWKTNIQPKVKAAVMILLGLGTVSSIATIIRLKYVIIIGNLQSSSGLASTQVQYSVEATIYSILELALSILAAGMAALRPLLRMIPFFADMSSNGKSGKSDNYQLRTFGQSSSRNTNKGTKLDDIDNDSEREIIGKRNTDSESQ